MTAPAPPTETTNVTARGEVRAIVAVTGVADDQGDVIEPGAIAASLAKRGLKLCNHHDQRRPIGRVVEAVELRPGDRRLPRYTADGRPWPRAAGALLLRAQLNLNTAAGREAHAELSFYGEDGSWSIGYMVPDGGAAQRRNGLRRIRRLDIVHASPVLVGASQHARTLEIKALGATQVKTLPARRRRWSEQVRADARTATQRKARAVPLGDLDELRRERIGRTVERWEREAAQLEDYTELVKRDPRYLMTASGVMLKVLPCERCGADVTFPLQAPTRGDAKVRCELCQR